MNVESLQLTVNSKGAQADLGALSRALDQAGRSFDAMASKFVSGATKTDAALGRAMGQAEKMAKVAALLGKVRVDGSAANALTQFAGALDALGRARSFNEQKLKSLQDFVKLLPSVRVPTGAARMAEFLNIVGNARAPSAATVRNLQAFLQLMANYRGTGATRNTQQLTAFLQAVAQARAPTQATIQRLQLFLQTLAGARPIPNARKIADDLLYVAQAAQRATLAFAGLPRSMGQLAGPANSAARAAAQLRANTAQTANGMNALGSRVASVRPQVQGLHADLGGLNDRFRLGYQLGTVFSAMFASFTIGQFIRQIYDSNIEIQKLGKAMLFTEGTFDGAQKATGDYLQMAYKMGLSIDKTVESYGRFMISAKASGVATDVSKRAFENVTMALQVVGASTEQTQYAFYGLTQMMQKGKVMSEELNRQIGEQIPGSAVAAAGALSKMLGRVVSVGEAFKLIQKGGVMSDKFVPLYGEELRKMYEPLMAMAQKRPDLALNRLIDSFKIFAIIVGQSGFMSQAGKGFDALSGKIVQLDKNGQLLVGPNGFPMLTKGAQELADKLGRNLATAVHTAADFLKMLLSHIPEVIQAIKIMIALKVGATFLEWANAAGQAASGFLGMGRAARAASTQIAALQAIQTAVTGGSAVNAGAVATGGVSAAARGMTSGVGIAAARAEAGLNTAAGYAGPGQVGIIPRNAGGFGRRGVGVARTVKTFDATAVEATGGILAMGTSFGKVESGAASLFSKLGPLASRFGLIGAAVLAVGAALYGYSQITTTVGGVAVKNADIMGAGFRILGAQIGKWWKDSGSKIKLFGVSFDDLGKNSGEVTATVVAGFIYLADVVGKVMESIGEAINGLLLGPFQRLFEVFDKLIHGDARGAVATMFKPVDLTWMDRASKDITDIGKISYDNIRKQVVAEAQAHSSIAGRGAPGAGGGIGDDMSAAARKKMEDQIKATNDARDESRRIANEQNNARMAKFGLLGEPLKFDDIRKELSDAISKGNENKIAASKTEAQKQIETARTTANIHVQGAKDAAQITIDAAKIAAGQAPAGGTPAWGGASSTQFAASIIKQHEGFRSSAYWDVNHFRVGYGSDTTTNAAGQFSNVTKNTSGITETDARRDLERRIGNMEGSIRSAVGPIWDTLATNVKAAIESVTYNYGSVPSRILGAVKTGDATKIAGAISGLGGDNNGVNRVRRAEEAQVALGNFGSVKGTAPGSEIAGMGQQQIDESQVDKEDQRLENVRTKWFSILAKIDPAKEGDTEYQKFLKDLEDVKDFVKDYNGKGGQGIAGIDLSAVDRANQLALQERADKVNPLGKANREVNQGFDLEEKRLKGLEDEAGWQEQLNKLNEQHFLYDQKILDTEKQKFLLGEQRKRQLQAQTVLVEAQVGAEIAALARTGSAKDVSLANLLNENYKGGDLASKRARASADGTLGTFQQTVDVNDASRRADALKAANGSLQEMAETSRLNPTAKALHDDYKEFLTQISGESANSLSELVSKTSAADQKIASDLALAKQKLENPPGFQKWADAVEPLAKRMEDIKGDFMNGLSDGISSALSGDTFDWRSMFHNVAKEMIQAQVNTGLQGIIQKFTGAPASPEQTQMTAATTQSTAATTFSQAVGIFAQAVGSAAAAGQAAGLGGTTGVTSALGGLGTAAGFTPSALAGLGTPNSTIPALAGLGALTGGAANDNALAGFTAPMAPVTMMPDALAGLGAASSAIPALAGLGPLTGGAAGTQAAGGGMLGGLGGLGMMALPMALAWLTRPKTPDVVPVDPLNGVIGTASDNTITSTQVAGHANIIGSLLSMAVGMAGASGFGAPGGNLTKFMQGGGSIGGALNNGFSGFMKHFGGFSEGGISTSPVHRIATAMTFHDAPRYREGTSNTSGEIPAILHPEEAVIPLSRGRSIPVEMNGAGGGQHVTVNSPIYISTPDANSFRSSQSSLQSNQNRTIRRAATRNLSKAA